MERSDITAGLRSAISRGYSLDFAKKSFINAGYNSQDVEDSANSLSDGLKFTIPKASGVTKTSGDGLDYSLKPISPNPSAPVINPRPVTSNKSSYKPLPVIPSNYNPVNSSSNSNAPGVMVEKKHSAFFSKFLLVSLVIVFLAVLGFLGLLLFSRPTAESIAKAFGLM
ncbi:hypothetical protein COU61_04155 [Candidatus Pacearchaeota archaeon CG10_big_fil_rev_8_21_14_0_10_35_13]|nr:MAG: hypothetical protein COU61_04155 [Candidatus Pacearchaeota archaeon CG10_big_fil_rev_8_21_14_0_10_35_13]